MKWKSHTHALPTQMQKTMPQNLHLLSVMLLELNSYIAVKFIDVLFQITMVFFAANAKHHLSRPRMTTLKRMGSGEASVVMCT